MLYRKIETIFFLLLILSMGSVDKVNAQTEILYTSFSGDPLPLESVNTCQDSVFINQVRVEITSEDVNQLSVSIDLPEGITYASGSARIVSDSGPSSPMSVVEQGIIAGMQSFRIMPDDLSVGDFFILEWGRQANCNAITGQQAGDFFKDGVVLNWEGMGTNLDLDESVRSYDLLVGSLSLVGEGQIVTSLGSTVMRELTITNGGQGVLDEFTFYIIDGVGITTSQLETLDGTIIPTSSVNGDTLFYTISTTEINEFGDFDNHLENGEQVVVKRTYTVSECDNYSGYGAYWGCIGSICQETTTLEQATVIDNLVPDVDVTQINLNEDYCYNGQNSSNGGVAVVQTFKMTNTGNGEARDLFMTLNSFQPGSNTGQNYFDIGDNWVVKDQNGNVIGAAIHSNTFRTANRRDENCTNAARAISVRYELDDVMIPAGEFITVEVPTYVQNLGCITSCPSSGVSWYSFSGGWEYKDQCELNNYGNTLKRFNAKAHNFKDYLVEMPTDLVDQQCFSLSVDFSRLYTRVKSTTEGYNDFVIDLKSTSLEYNGGPTISTPFGVVSVTDLGDSVVIRLPNNLSNATGVMPVELKADCAGQVGGVQTILFSNKASYDGNEDCSLYTHECLSNTYQMHCPAPCPRGGATPKLFTLERITYGLPDSNDDGIPDVSGTVDLDAINLHRAVNGDTVLGTWNIYVNPNVFDAVENPTDPNIGVPFNYTYIEFDLRDYPLSDCSPDNDPDFETLFSPVPNAEVVIYPANGGPPIMCTVSATLEDDPDTPANTNTIAKYDLSSCKTTWEGGDSIVVKAKYVTHASLNNSGFNLYISDNEVYSSYVPNPIGDNPSDESKYTCDKFNDFMNVLRIYHSPYMPSTQDISGCTNQFQSFLRQYINVQANNVWFPNEYRSFFIQDRYVIAWPPELVYRSGSATYDGMAIPDEDIMQVGDSLIFSNLRQFYQPYGGSILPNDEVQSHSVKWKVDPTCDAEVGAIYNSKFYGENIGNGINATINNSTAYRSCDNKFSGNVNMQFDGPLPFISGGGSVQVYSDTARWEVLLNNGSNDLIGPNTWFYINDVNGTLSDFTLSRGGSEIIPDANGFFQLGNNSVGNSEPLEIEGILMGCGDSEIEVLSGYSCSGYPTDLDVLECADIVLLKSTPLPSEVQVSFITQPNSPMELCQNQTIKLRQTSSQAAYLDNPRLSFIVPNGVIMPANINVEYPENSGNIETLTPTIVGSEWTINFEEHSEIGAEGIPGTIGAITPEERSVVIDFDFNTNCDFLSGANFIFKGLGQRPCGEVANNNGLRVRTVDLNVQGANKPYINNFTLDMPAFEGCTPTTVSAEIQFVNLSTMMTSEMDSVYITLEENLEFVPGSFTCTNSNAAECLVFSYLTTDIAGDETIVLSMPPGGLDIDIPLTTSFTYQVILGNQDLCGDMKNIMYSVVTNLEDVPCASEATGFCPSLAVTLGEEDVDILVKKSIATFDSESIFCNESIGVTFSGSIQLSEVPLLIGESLVLDIYCADGAGNPVLYTESITFEGPIAISENLDFEELLSSSCNPSNGVVIQASRMAIGGVENCICSDQSLFIPGSETLECTAVMDSPVSCNGENNGSATVTAVGGNGSYTYLWDNMESTATATMLTTGIHAVTITDILNCQAICSVTVEGPEKLSCSIEENTPVTCNGDGDGNATVTIFGGNPSYSITWDNGESGLTASSLDGGLHSVTIMDSKNCQTTCDIIIGEPDGLTCSILKNNDPLCDGNNGSATVTAFGGNGNFTYLWSSGETTATATALAGGLATVTITDDKDCQTTCSIEMMDQLDCISINKTLVSTEVTSANCYDVQYKITVDNFGVVPIEYDLTDTTAFDDDIVIVSASYVSDAMDFSPIMLNTSGEWILANNQEIIAGKLDSYTMTVEVCIDLSDGIVGDDIYTACGNFDNSILPNEGLFNTVSIDIDNDGIANAQVSDCGDLPYITHEKIAQSISNQNIDLSYDVVYTIEVKNEGGAIGIYDLFDIPNFDDDIIILGGSYSSTNGLTGLLSITNGATNILASNQSISASSIDVYTIIFNVTLDLSLASTDIGDNFYSACGTTDATGGLSPGEALYNSSALDLNHDGIPEEISEVCGDLPYIIHEKTGPIISAPNADLSYDIVYTIEVKNEGGATGIYSLSDIPNFDDDILINSAFYTSDNGLNGTLSNTIGAANKLADNQTIGAGDMDRFTVTFNATIDLNPTSLDGGDNAYISCVDLSDPLTGDIPQQALLNLSTLDTNNDGIPEEESYACGELPFVILEKLDPIVSDRKADGTYDVSYSILVSNIGGADETYDLFDTPKFEDDITINTASYSAAGLLLGSLSTNNDTQNQLADDVILGAGNSDMYTVMFNVTLDLSGTGTDNGDNSYDACGSSNGGITASPFEGLYNLATIDTNNDGIAEQEDDACGDIYIFDLAIKKSVNPDQDIVLGSEVKYTITVYNQGNINAQNIEVIEYLPIGIEFVSSNDSDVWTYDMVSNTAVGLITDVILPGESTTLDLIGIVRLGPDWTNIVEILSSQDDKGNDTSNDDIDSTPNADPGDDNGDASTDDKIDDDGTIDEDDQDPATIEVFDLAFVKTSLTTESVNIGDEVSFELKVFNQGNVPAYAVEVTDYISSGFVYDQSMNPLWMSSGSAVTSVIDGPIGVGDSATVLLHLIVTNDGSPRPEDWFNEGEISSADNDYDPSNDQPIDFDSTPDNDPHNDNDVIPGDDNDNEIYENGIFGIVSGDEDDNDVSLILVNGAIGHYVWNDTNANGIQDSSEEGIDGVIVNVLDSEGNIFTSVTTNEDGFYLVENLAPGEYQVQFITEGLDEIYYPSLQDESGDDTEDSDADENGYTIFTNIISGEIDTTWDAGFYEPASIGDFVWHDINGDGIQNIGEPGLADVTINLYNDDAELIAITKTNINGYYLFEEVLPDSYFVEFIDPEGYTSTFAEQGSDNLLDSDVTNEIVVQEGGSTTDLIVVNPGVDYLSIDAGYYQCIPIGETVWYDTNTDNVESPSENGINGMLVTLWRFTNGTWQEWDDAYTGYKPGTPSDDGYFKFCAPPGTYYLHFELPPQGLVQVQPNVGSALLDSDVTNANGLGTTNTFTVLSGDLDCTLGAGYYPMAEVGNFVWEDSNLNGIQEVSESPLAGVVVQAYDLNDIMINEVVTDEAGAYNMDYLQQQSYYLKFTPPPGYGVTIANATSDDEVDSDVTHAYGANTTNAYALNSGVQVINIDAGMAFGVLPVEWLDVRAERRGDHNLVEWSTATEINSEYFEIERRVGNAPYFESIGKVDAAGMSLSEIEYDFDDEEIYQADVYYYRIKQVDTDGRVDYSDIVSVMIEQVGTTINMYPNPAINATMIMVNGSVENALVSIYTKDGKKIKSGLQLVEISPNNFELGLDVSSLLPGIYTIQIDINQNVWTEKLIIIK